MPPELPGSSTPNDIADCEPGWSAQSFTDITTHFVASSAAVAAMSFGAHSGGGYAPCAIHLSVLARNTGNDSS